MHKSSPPLKIERWNALTTYLFLWTNHNHAISSDCQSHKTHLLPSTCSGHQLLNENICRHPQRNTLGLNRSDGTSLSQIPLGASLWQL